MDAMLNPHTGQVVAEDEDGVIYELEGGGLEMQLGVKRYVLQELEGDEDLEEEAVLLGFRQRIGSLLLDRVLRRQDEEGVRQRIALAADGHLALLHGFEQGGLRFRRRPVDLICEDDIGEDRPLEEAEFSLSAASALVDDLRAGDVGGHEVRGELDPVEIQPQAVSQRPDQEGLGEAGNALDDAVPAGEDSDEKLLNDIFLANDDLADFCPEFVKALLHAFDFSQV